MDSESSGAGNSSGSMTVKEFLIFMHVGITGPFKTYCAKAQENWQHNNPGKTISIYEIPENEKHAWPPLAATLNNFMNAFKKAGINKSFVTDRPMPDTNISNMESQLQEIAGPEEIQNPATPENVVQTEQTENAVHNNCSAPSTSSSLSTIP
ncbi:unnamed protein product [Pieris macdunnoughi]|uniref:Uncharacterized protein n=1 Tax=Pieris macdunnoughi TaxID=345717 RepID=A0A821UI58_9NEOP|nr:unnamed protein product [Pieris macdunnoughi]